ncbi:MAG: hypothetical protein AAGA09_02635 [Pseudomonadota bacterium]
MRAVWFVAAGLLALFAAGLWVRFANTRRARRMNMGGAITVLDIDRDRITVSGLRNTPITIDLAQIHKVAFFKRDLMTVDLICCEIGFTDDEGAGLLILDEEMARFDDVAEWLKALPGFQEDWFLTVFAPAFEENYTVAFEKSA